MVTLKDLYKKSVIDKIMNITLKKRTYKNSRKKLIKLLKKNQELSYHEWNDYAYKNGYFSSIVIMDHENVDNWEGLIKKLI